MTLTSPSKNTLYIFATRGRFKANYVAKTEVMRESLLVRTYMQSTVFVFQFFAKIFRGDTELGMRFFKRKETPKMKHISNWI